MLIFEEFQLKKLGKVGCMAVLSMASRKRKLEDLTAEEQSHPSLLLPLLEGRDVRRQMLSFLDRREGMAMKEARKKITPQLEPNDEQALQADIVECCHSCPLFGVIPHIQGRIFSFLALKDALEVLDVVSTSLVHPTNETANLVYEHSRILGHKELRQQGIQWGYEYAQERVILHVADTDMERLQRCLKTLLTHTFGTL